MEKELIIKTADDWGLLTSYLILNINPGNTATLITLEGDLGAGKTTFVQRLAKDLGIEEVVNSPTFTIMKSYELKAGGPYSYLIHMDAYRIEDVKELEPLRFSQIMNTPGVLMCIEWPQNIKVALPANACKVVISNHQNGGRLVKVTH